MYLNFHIKVYPYISNYVYLLDKKIETSYAMPNSFFITIKLYTKKSKNIMPLACIFFQDLNLGTF